MRFTYLILLPVLLIGLASCSSDDGNPVDPSDSKDLWPLAVGNYWIYQHTTYDADTIISTNYDTLRIVRTEIDSENQTWYVSDESPEPPSPMYRNSARGLEAKHGEVYLYFPHPATIGNMNVFPTTDEPLGIRVDGKNEQVTTPAGTFLATKYALLEGGVKLETWHYIAPGVGLVKSQDNPETQRYVTVSELIKYHLE